MTGIRPPSPAPDVRTAAPRGGGHAFTKAELAALRPHVILLDDGRLSSTTVEEPSSVEEFTTTDADIEAIFTTHLPDFVKDHAPGPVPIVIYAHGGLVDRQSGFEIALQQVDWWKENGVYPIHFVWQTAFGTALWDALRRWTTGGRRGWLDEAKDGFLETAARLLGGGGIWNDMKVDAAAASVDGGGGAKFAAGLGKWIADHPDAVTVHAVGHSAGSIFHSHFIPRALEQEQHPIAEFETVSFLAPAVRVDTFNKKLLEPARKGRIGRLAVFDMDDDTERDDNCAHIYNKSLLYLVSASFEPQKSTPILGLEKHLTTDAALGPFFTSPQRRADLVLAPLETGARSTSTATSHGAFDDDAPTMESVAKRVSGKASVTKFPAGEARTRGASVVGDRRRPGPGAGARRRLTGCRIARRRPTRALHRHRPVPRRGRPPPGLRRRREGVGDDVPRAGVRRHGAHRRRRHARRHPARDPRPRQRVGPRRRARRAVLGPRHLRARPRRRRGRRRRRERRGALPGRLPRHRDAS